MAGRKHRERVEEAFAEFHAAAGRALGAADRLREDAVRRQALSMFALWLRRDGLEAARADRGLAGSFAAPALRGVVRASENDRSTALGTWARSGPARLADLVAAHAPGAAGAEGTAWLGQVPFPGAAAQSETGDPALDGIKDFPTLWRIGSGRLAPGPSFPVAVPLLEESHLRVDSRPRTRARAEELVELLLLRLFSAFRPGVLRVDVWDGSQYTLFPGLHPLSRTGLVTAHDPNDLDGLLDQLAERVHRVHSRVLSEGDTSLRDYTERTGKRSEPWQVVVLAGNRAPLPEEQQRRLQRIARSGLTAGIQLVLLDLPVTVAAPVESVRFTADGVRCSMTGEHIAVTPDPLPGRGEVTGACDTIVRAHEGWRSRVRGLAEFLPRDGWMTGNSAAGLQTDIGDDDGSAVELRLDDASPHALIGGPSGSGKTNLLIGMITSLAARYSPSELQFYLLDFKEGVSFAQFAPGQQDKTWLPHAQLIGINVNTDREFGLALLQFLADEMRRRADVAKQQEVTKLEELRRADPEGHWPRIVAIVDEFQFLFAENDALAKRATNLLEDVARRGRSQGIHLVFASQDVSGIEAFWGRPAIFEQFVLRIALPRARRVLATLNEAAQTLPKWHAIVNHESGVKHGNEIARIPDASKDVVHEVQVRAHEQFGAESPRVFDGASSPALGALVADLPAGEPLAVVGQVIDMEGSPAAVRLPDAPGRNVAVFGSGSRDALRVMGGAAAGLARTAPSGARFLLAPLVGDPAGIEQVLGEVETVALADFRARVEELAATVRERAAGSDRSPVFLLVLGADAADPLLERAGTEAFRTVLRFGPEVGVHVVGWWRSATRLKQLLSMSASVDDVGAWIGLDVQGAELAPFASLTSTTWSPRPGRGLFFDRAQHSRPEVVLVPGDAR
ncbi:FtsK/SpoIIIE domain-containing protein [Pseudonocardia ailaonensis]|uniref:FtsK/SpoIIIE domain-containing protein n=1 Tax=Pseudonocardia ailaonensis TaxID=367279 RepID=UPI0031E3BCA1